MAQGILVLVEQQDGRPKKTALELLSKARGLNIGPVYAAVMGGPGTDLTNALNAQGVATIYSVTAPELKDFQSGPWVRALDAVVREAGPAVVLASATPIGKDILPRVAARSGSGMASDCIDLSVLRGDRLKARRPIYAGKALIDVEIPEGIQFFTIRPNSFPVTAPGASSSARVVQVSAAFTAGDLRAKLVEVVKGASEKVDLTEADRIVSGGRSLGSAENFKVLEELAQVIGAAMGASRAAVDAGYAPHDMQVGQTGKTVNPTLYMAFGISGAIQHLAGMRSSRVIVAINKDADAPIFQLADYGLIGDLFQAAPAITQEMRKLLAH